MGPNYELHPFQMEKVIKDNPGNRETPAHFFAECICTINLWNHVKSFFSPLLNLCDLTPQSALLGFLDAENDYIILNYILLIFKYCIYKNRKSTLNHYMVINKIKSVYKIEKHLALEKKWAKIATLLE